MKKAGFQNEPGAGRTQKAARENVWCAKFGYFIDLEACRARSRQKRACRRCYQSLLQVPLPFEAP
jgi:hypothetical protein